MLHRFFEGNGPMAVTIEDFTDHGSYEIRVAEVRLHLSAAGGAGNFTITVDSAESDKYDSILNTQDMTGAQDEIYAPDNPPRLRPVDGLRFEWANANARIWGLEVIYSLDPG